MNQSIVSGMYRKAAISGLSKCCFGHLCPVVINKAIEQLPVCIITPFAKLYIWRQSILVAKCLNYHNGILYQKMLIATVAAQTQKLL